MNSYFHDYLISVFQDKSAQLLLLSNFASIIVAVIFSWSYIDVMFAYWCQSLIIGFFSIFKILVAGIHQKEVIALFLFPFFILHFGMFHFLYFVFLTDFGFKITNFDSISLIFIVGLFFVNHLISFILNLRKISEVSPETLFWTPYIRIVPMHLSIILGAIVLSVFNSNFLVILLFMFLKTIADLVSHKILL